VGAPFVAQGRAVMRSCPPPPPTPAVEAALRAHVRRFGRFKMTHLSGGCLNLEALLLRQAVKRKRPLRYWLIERVSGGWRRDPGPDAIL
jgi:hypothetical protein